MYVLFITLIADRVLMLCYARYVLTIKIQSRRAINAPKEGSMICTAHHGNLKNCPYPRIGIGALVMCNGYPEQLIYGAGTATRLAGIICC